MSIELAIRLTEILLGIALMQQSIEHLGSHQKHENLFLTKLVLSALLVSGNWTTAVSALLFINGALILKLFQGPYNGGSDRISMFTLLCLCLTHIPGFEIYALGYLSLQLILSYLLPGFYKLSSANWRSGKALQGLFSYSIYPRSEALRSWANHPGLLTLASWVVIVFELAFPLALIKQEWLFIALGIAMLFHLSNALLFGLNRFVWAWLAAYPALICFQQYIGDKLWTQ